MKRKTKVGILTWHDPSNCGSTLQAYALHVYLRDKGIDAEIINYIPQWCRGDCMQMPLRTLSIKQRIKRHIKETLVIFYDYLPKFLQRKTNPFFQFYNHFCKMTAACTEDTITDVCQSFTTIISGSDQIWNPNFLDSIFLQSFADNHINKISYAASLGGNILPEGMKSIFKNYLQTFHAISVRENEGKNLLKSIGISSDVHIDPTLLLDASHYRSIAKPILNIKKPFVFCYFLSTDQEYKRQVIEYIQALKLKAIGFSANNEDYQWMKKIDNMGPCEWLWLIDNADIVITNSYHATILSLVLHTPFFTFLRFDAKSSKSQNARMEQLKSYFEIADYLVSSKIPNIPAYPFSKFAEKLPALQQKANEYLINNIK